MPDLATYQRLVTWLGISSDAFIQPSRVRLDPTPDIVAEHLHADKNLTPDAANHIAAIVSDLYNALRTSATAPVAMHLRAAKTFEPAAMQMLGALLDEMQTALLLPSA